MITNFLVTVAMMGRSEQDLDIWYLFYIRIFQIVQFALDLGSVPYHFCQTRSVLF